MGWREALDAIPIKQQSAAEVSADHLPEHAQDIYREAFNHAYEAHAGELNQEKRAHMIAWGAVSGLTSR